MRAIPLFLLSSATLANTAGAAPPANSQAASALLPALHAVLPAMGSRPSDPDQGDDNASLRAISIVCSHDNPSATHAAICPVPISPS
jgi:hypothetical protein